MIIVLAHGLRGPPLAQPVALGPSQARVRLGVLLRVHGSKQANVPPGSHRGRQVGTVVGTSSLSRPRYPHPKRPPLHPQ